MSGILIRHLAYLGPDKRPAAVSFEAGLNVVCGASDTGKTFIVESIDFMLGQEKPVRDIPERAGYDRIRISIDAKGRTPLTLERSVEGGDFRSYEELTREASPQTEGQTLRWKHSSAHKDTISYALLDRIGLTGKVLRRNAAGDTRSLSFRDLARLCVVTEEEIITSGSPLLSGQYVSGTAEYAVFKLLLTGVDDSALVAVEKGVSRRENETGKIEILDQMIEELKAEMDDEEESEIVERLSHLEKGIEDQNEALSKRQKALDALLEVRASVAREIRSRRARLGEIEELVGRFGLLDTHYKTDLDRLEAIRESGTLFSQLDNVACPLCGALPNDQHLDTSCEGNAGLVVQAADAEVAKIERLRRELSDTILTLTKERGEINQSLGGLEAEYKASEREINEIASPSVLAERSSYNQLVSERSRVLASLDKIARLKRMIVQRSEIDGDISQPESDQTATKTQVSRNVLDEYAQKVEAILQEWHFPNSARVFFDESKRDLQIAGKNRGSTGKGLRAITHAAIKIGLMEFCIEHELPHPGFVVLDSPLLAYWKPEGDDDDLRGTDVKEMFYRYLIGLENNQVIIIENQHPPDFVLKEAHVEVFTKNAHRGRYGLFPIE